MNTTGSSNVYIWVFISMAENKQSHKQEMHDKQTKKQKQDKQMLAKYNNNHSTPEQIYYQHQFKLPNIW